MRNAMAVLTTALVGLAWSAAPVAAQAKMGFVDVQRVFAEAPGAQAAQTTFEQEMQRSQQELQRMEEELKKLLTEYEQQSVMLSPDNKRQREEAIRQRQRTFQERAGQLEEQLSRRQVELVEPIYNRIRDVIGQLRNEGNYAFIFDMRDAGIVAADPALDLTEQVLTRLRSTAQAGTGGR
jgi:outer membrane protein